jgi:hypothetical protein
MWLCYLPLGTAETLAGDLLRVTVTVSGPGGSAKQTSGLVRIAR